MKSKVDFRIAMRFSLRVFLLVSAFAIANAPNALARWSGGGGGGGFGGRGGYGGGGGVIPWRLGWVRRRQLWSFRLVGLRFLWTFIKWLRKPVQIRRSGNTYNNYNNRLRNTTATTSRPQNPAALPVPPTSSRTTTSTTQTSRPRSRPNTTKRILFKRTMKRPKSSCRTSKMPRSTTTTTRTTTEAAGAIAITMVVAEAVRVVARSQVRPRSVLSAEWQSAR